MLVTEELERALGRQWDHDGELERALGRQWDHETTLAGVRGQPQPRATHTREPPNAQNKMHWLERPLVG